MGNPIPGTKDSLYWNGAQVIFWPVFVWEDLYFRQCVIFTLFKSNWSDQLVDSKLKPNFHREFYWQCPNEWNIGCKNTKMTSLGDLGLREFNLTIMKLMNNFSLSNANFAAEVFPESPKNIKKLTDRVTSTPSRLSRGNIAISRQNN